MDKRCPQDGDNTHNEGPGNVVGDKINATFIGVPELMAAMLGAFAAEEYDSFRFARLPIDVHAEELEKLN